MPSIDESPLGDPKKLASVLSDTDNVIGIDPSIICSETDERSSPPELVLGATISTSSSRHNSGSASGISGLKLSES